MTPVLLSFAAGVLLLQMQGQLPAGEWAWLASAGVLPFVVHRLRVLALPLAALAGFCGALGLAHARLADKLAPELEGRDIEVVGIVSGLPSAGERGQRFEFEPEAVLAPAGAKLPQKLLLSWYRTPFMEEGGALSVLHPGERWRLSLRLRRPHGQVNPHGFDYEAWLLERGIGATGYVRQKGARTLLGTRSAPLDRIARARASVRERFEKHLGATPAAGILTALAVGDQRAISAEEWRLFGRTGVTHLMSISGLHVTLVSGLLAWLVAAGWRRVPALALRLPARKAAAVAAIVGALGYTLLAGFAVPAQRTFFMVSVVALALWQGRIASPLRVLALALALVVALDPWAPLSPGLWLSFGAVLVIFYVGAAWSRPEPRLLPHLLQLGRVQWAITVGLAPAAVFLFGEVSVAGPLANAVAIPLVSGVVTPLALAAAVVPVDALLDLAAWLVQGLLQFLEWCAALPAAVWVQHAPPAWALVLALAGVAWLLAPPGVPSRFAGLVLMAPALLVAPPRPAEGEAWITTLDVGQGLAVLVRTSERALLYDTGPAYGPDADSGGRVVLPLLRASGIERLDEMVITHEDTDHLGGALTVLEALPVGLVRSSLPRAHPLHAFTQARPCIAGDAWAWDGVRFEVLHPAQLAGRRNDRSCVMRIATQGGALLLTGDIERGAEAELVARRAGLRSDVLLMPHHGSRTSSSAALLEAVAPRWGIAAAGYRNRFGHPGPEVVERYRAAGARVLRTDLDGAVHVLLGTSAVHVEPERDRRRRYWRGAPRV
jgi:competence protein ComEC